MVLTTRQRVGRLEVQNEAYSFCCLLVSVMANFSWQHLRFLCKDPGVICYFFFQLILEMKQLRGTGLNDLLRVVHLGGRIFTLFFLTPSLGQFITVPLSCPLGFRHTHCIHLVFCLLGFFPRGMKKSGSHSDNDFFFF